MASFPAAGNPKALTSKATLLLLYFWITISACQASGLPDVVTMIKPSIVGVGTMLYSRRPAGEFLGTGFAVWDGRHVITNAHVVQGFITANQDRADEFPAVFAGSGSKVAARRARVVVLDREHDLALLRFDGDPLPPLTLAFERPIREGEMLAFTGFPVGTLLGMYPATHRGIVASVTPITLPLHHGGKTTSTKLTRVSPYAVYQLDATAYPGNSGSPLYLPDSGQVVGVINKVFVRGQREQAIERPSGITYAIPVRHVLKLLRTAGLHH